MKTDGQIPIEKHYRSLEGNEDLEGMLCRWQFFLYQSFYIKHRLFLSRTTSHMDSSHLFTVENRQNQHLSLSEDR